MIRLFQVRPKKLPLSLDSELITVPVTRLRSDHYKTSPKKVLPSVASTKRTKGATRKNHSIINTRFFRVNGQNLWSFVKNDCASPLAKALIPIFITFAIRYVRLRLNLVTP